MLEIHNFENVGKTGTDKSWRSVLKILENVEYGINIFLKTRNWHFWIFATLKPRNFETKKPMNQNTEKPTNFFKWGNPQHPSTHSEIKEPHLFRLCSGTNKRFVSICHLILSLFQLIQWLKLANQCPKLLWILFSAN